METSQQPAAPETPAQPVVPSVDQRPETPPDAPAPEQPTIDDEPCAPEQPTAPPSEPAPRDVYVALAEGSVAYALQCVVSAVEPLTPLQRQRVLIAASYLLDGRPEAP